MAATDHIVTQINARISRLQDRSYDRTARRTLDPQGVLTPAQYKQWQRLPKLYKARMAAEKAYQDALAPFYRENHKKGEGKYYFNGVELEETNAMVERRLYGTKTQREAKIAALKALRSDVLIQAASGELTMALLQACKKLGVL